MKKIDILIEIENDINYSYFKGNGRIKNRWFNAFGDEDPCCGTMNENPNNYPICTGNEVPADDCGAIIDVGPNDEPNTEWEQQEMQESEEEEVEYTCTDVNSASSTDQQFVAMACENNAMGDNSWMCDCEGVAQYLVPDEPDPVEGTCEYLDAMNPPQTWIDTTTEQCQEMMTNSEGVAVMLQNDPGIPSEYCPCLIPGWTPYEYVEPDPVYTDCVVCSGPQAGQVQTIEGNEGVCASLSGVSGMPQLSLASEGCPTAQCISCNGTTPVGSLTAEWECQGQGQSWGDYDPNMCDINGCTDSEATNYNAQANVDDGSCAYEEETCPWLDANTDADYQASMTEQCQEMMTNDQNLAIMLQNDLGWADWACPCLIEGWTPYVYVEPEPEVVPCWKCDTQEWVDASQWQYPLSPGGDCTGLNEYGANYANPGGPCGSSGCCTFDNAPEYDNSLGFSGFAGRTRKATGRTTRRNGWY